MRGEEGGGNERGAWGTRKLSTYRRSEDEKTRDSHEDATRSDEIVRDRRQRGISRGGHYLNLPIDNRVIDRKLR